MSVLSAPILQPPTVSNSGGADGQTSITVYVGKMPESFNNVVMDALLEPFRPQLFRWRRSEGSDRRTLMPFGFADFSDASAADTFRRVFEALELPVGDEKNSGAKSRKLLVKVDARTEDLITDGTTKTMEQTVNQMIEEEKRRIAALPPGMEDVTLDEDAVVERAKKEYIQQRDSIVATKLGEVRKILEQKISSDSQGKPSEEKNAEEEEKAIIRRTKLDNMDKEEEEKARLHNQRDKERKERAFAGHEKSYKERERTRMYRIAKCRSVINGIPAAKRKRPFSKKDRDEEAEKDRLDREAELREIEEQKQKEQEGQQGCQQQNDQSTSDVMVDSVDSSTRS